MSKIWVVGIRIMNLGLKINMYGRVKSKPKTFNLKAILGPAKRAFQEI